MPHISSVVIRENLDSVVFADLYIDLADDPRVPGVSSISGPEISPVPDDDVSTASTRSDSTESSSSPSSSSSRSRSHSSIGAVRRGATGTVLVVVFLVHNDDGGAGRRAENAFLPVLSRYLATDECHA